MAPARGQLMLVIVRAVTYSVLFIGFVLVFLPARVLLRAGVTAPPPIGAVQVLGMLVTSFGAAMALWCISTFAVVGEGTPAPFDPPRRLVVRGPYRFVRNPMYLGAATALFGAALVYESMALAAYAVGFLVLVHAFVVGYEEPTLRATFGADYDGYCRRVHRWRPER